MRTVKSKINKKQVYRIIGMPEPWISWALQPSKTSDVTTDVRAREQLPMLTICICYYL